VTEAPTLGPPSSPGQLGPAIGRFLSAAGHRVKKVECVDRVTAGANRQTVLVEVRIEGDEEPQRIVVQMTTRSPDESWMLPVGDEGAVITAAGEAGVPVPVVLGAGHWPELEVDVLATAYVEGETIPRRVLRTLDQVDGWQQTMAQSCGQALGALHGLHPSAVSPLGKPLETLWPETYLDHLRHRLDLLPWRYPTFRFALAVLADDLPTPPDRPSIVHGDFRNGNLIVADGLIQAVLDWELAHLGDPMEDLAWLCLRTWRFGHDHLEVGGFASRSDLERAYIEAGGQWRHDAFDWWTMARTVWWGIGLAAQAARFIDGSSTSIVHAASGRRVVELEYDLLNLLAALRSD